MNGDGEEPHFSDAVGKPIPRPLVPPQVASPINLLNPDKYEFYTFDDNGELIKRLMTLREIQSIVANGNGAMVSDNDGDKETQSIMINSMPLSNQAADTKVQDIVNNVQSVLQKEMESKKNFSVIPQQLLDTPDVSSSWSIILPAIFGNTGDEILPQKQINSPINMTPDSEVFEATEKMSMSSSTTKTEVPITTTQKATVKTTTKRPATTQKATIKTTITAATTKRAPPKFRPSPSPIFTRTTSHSPVEITTQELKTQTQQETAKTVPVTKRPTTQASTNAPSTFEKLPIISTTQKKKITTIRARPTMPSTLKAVTKRVTTIINNKVVITTEKVQPPATTEKKDEIKPTPYVQMTTLTSLKPESREPINEQVINKIKDQLNESLKKTTEKAKLSTKKASSTTTTLRPKLTTERIRQTTERATTEKARPSSTEQTTTEQSTTERSTTKRIKLTTVRPRPTTERLTTTERPTTVKLTTTTEKVIEKVSEKITEPSTTTTTTPVPTTVKIVEAIKQPIQVVKTLIDAKDKEDNPAVKAVITTTMSSSEEDNRQDSAIIQIIGSLQSDMSMNFNEKTTEKDFESTTNEIMEKVHDTNLSPDKSFIDNSLFIDEGEPIVKDIPTTTTTPEYELDATLTPEKLMATIEPFIDPTMQTKFAENSEIMQMIDKLMKEQHIAKENEDKVLIDLMDMSKLKFENTLKNGQQMQSDFNLKAATVASILAHEIKDPEVTTASPMTKPKTTVKQMTTVKAKTTAKPLTTVKPTKSSSVITKKVSSAIKQLPLSTTSLKPRVSTSTAAPRTPPTFKPTKKVVTTTVAQSTTDKPTSTPLTTVKATKAQTPSSTTEQLSYSESSTEQISSTEAISSTSADITKPQLKAEQITKAPEVTKDILSESLSNVLNQIIMENGSSTKIKPDDIEVQHLLGYHKDLQSNDEMENHDKFDQMEALSMIYENLVTIQPPIQEVTTKLDDLITYESSIVKETSSVSIQHSNTMNSSDDVSTTSTPKKLSTFFFIDDELTESAIQESTTLKSIIDVTTESFVTERKSSDRKEEATVEPTLESYEDPNDIVSGILTAIGIAGDEEDSSNEQLRDPSESQEDDDDEDDVLTSITSEFINVAGEASLDSELLSVADTIADQADTSDSEEDDSEESPTEVTTLKAIKVEEKTKPLTLAISTTSAPKLNPTTIKYVTKGASKTTEKPQVLKKLPEIKEKVNATSTKLAQTTTKAAEKVTKLPEVTTKIPTTTSSPSTTTQVQESTTKLTQESTTKLVEPTTTLENLTVKLGSSTETTLNKDSTTSKQRLDTSKEDISQMIQLSIIRKDDSLEEIDFITPPTTTVLPSTEGTYIKLDKIEANSIPKLSGFKNKGQDVSGNIKPIYIAMRTTIQPEISTNRADESTTAYPSSSENTEDALQSFYTERVPLIEKKTFEPEELQTTKATIKYSEVIPTTSDDNLVQIKVQLKEPVNVLVASEPEPSKMTPLQSTQQAIKINAMKQQQQLQQPRPQVLVELPAAPKEALGLAASTVNLDSDLKDFSRLCNELAFSFWKSITADGISQARSVVISPFALSSTLSMIFLGARGQTSGEMNDLLRLDDMVTFNPHVIFRNITESVEQSRKTSGIAAAAFVRELYSDRTKGKLLPYFKDKAQQFYGAHVEEVNFNVINDILRRRTNLLVKRHTYNKINEYLKTNNIWVNEPLAAISANVFMVS